MKVSFRRAFWCCALLTGIFPRPLFPQYIDLPTREEEDDQFSFQLGVYEQTDGAGDLGGNPFIDEEETVYEAIIILDKKMSERDRMNVRFLGDLVSSASITRENNPMFQALQSNPSGNEHGELGFGWTREFDGYSLGGNAMIGAEYSNYQSAGLGANLNVPLPNGNTQVSLKYQGFLDLFEIKLFNGLEPGRDHRLTHTLEGAITQVLTPTTVANIVLNYTRQSGFLATTWHSVFVGGVEVPERVPSVRRRSSITARIKQSISDSNAMELGYRYYDDSWDITSHTYEAKFFQYLFDRKLLVEPNIRYYEQTGAFFYDTTFFEPLAFMSSDPDLSGFDGRSFGLKGTLIKPSWLRGWRADISLSFDYYTKDNGIDSFWTTVGYSAKF